MPKYFFILFFFLFFHSGRGESSQLSLDERLAEKIKYHQEGHNFIGYLYIGPDRSIDQTTYLHVKFALEEYKRRNVAFVLLHLNTPGGEVYSAMKIAELLLHLDSEDHIPVVGFINNWALSAGAMLAYACRFIVITENSLMGAAEPVISNAEGKMESASEKIKSALRAEFASLAKFYGRNPLIAEAMVDKDLILVKRDQNIIQLNSPLEIRTEGINPDQIITTYGKLLTLDCQQLMQWGVADLVVPLNITSSVKPSAEQTGGDASVAQLFKIPFFSSITDPKVIDYRSWKISFFAFLTNPLISSLLMIGLVIGVYLEMNQPGLGLPAGIAFACLGLILVSHFAAETIHWLEILFILLGILLVLAEIFVMPGGWLIGGIGILFLLFGIFAVLLPHFESVNFSFNTQEWNIFTIEFVHRLTFYLAALIIALAGIALLARYFTPRLLKKSRIVLDEEPIGNRVDSEYLRLPAVGTEAEALTSLRPGGKILIGLQPYDALAELSFIEKGDKVIVSKIQGSVIIVSAKH